MKGKGEAKAQVAEQVVVVKGVGVAAQPARQAAGGEGWDDLGQVAVAVGQHPEVSA